LISGRSAGGDGAARSKDHDDFFGVWLLLMFKRYDRFAAHVVTLGRARPATVEIVALLRSRTGWTSTTA